MSESHPGQGVTGTDTHPFGKNPPYECPECGADYEHRSGVSYHLENADCDVGVPCPSCDRRFRSRKGMRDHHKQEHGESLIYKQGECVICGDSYTYDSSSTDNSVTCSPECQTKYLGRKRDEASGPLQGETVSCGSCGETVFEQYLTDHLKECAPKTLAECDGCGELFRSEIGVNQHKSRTQCGEFEHECPECGRGCVVLSGVLQHMRDCCPEEMVDCPSCDKLFRTKLGADKHHKRVHGESTYGKLVECHTCGDLTRKRDYKIERNDHHFCGPDCYGDHISENLTRENSPRWNGGTLSYYGPNWGEQSQKARDRDDYNCQYCGADLSDKDEEPDVHHIKRIMWFKQNYDAPEWYEKANRLANLRTACDSCHGSWEGIPITPQLD